MSFWWRLLERLGVETAGYNRMGLHLAGLDSRWGLAVAGVLVGAYLLFTWSSLRDLDSRTRRWFLFAWHWLTALFILAIALEPSLQLKKTVKIKDRVSVLIDSSASMSLPADKDRSTRSQQAIDFLARNRGYFQKLEQEFVVSYYKFSDQVSRLPGFPEQAPKPEGSATDIPRALAEAASAGAAPLAGVVLLSDGADTSGLFQEKTRSASPDKSRGDEKKRAFSFSAPVNTVACGGDGELKDISIVKVEHDEYGFVHNPFEVRVKIRVEGGFQGELPVVFKQGDKVLASKSLALPGQGGELEKVLGFTPRQVGKFMFSVEAPELAGEVTGLNNLVRFPLRILRDKIRILYIVGNPSWDQRFLRRTLKKNPSVDLVSFYILREHWDDYQARQEEVSLIPFPTDKLFTKELDTFDLVIWQNFRGPLYMPGKYREYMEELNRFVRVRGGALLMLGGPRGFFGQGKMDPALLDLLPVIPSDRIPNYVKDEFKPALTEAGLRHPIMAVGEAEESPASVWAALPPLSGFNEVKQLKPDSLSLMVHPFREGEDGKPLPLIAVREAGQGRVMAVMTDCSWMWSFVAAGMGLSNKPYQRFWENALRWLLRDPEMRLISISSDKARVKPGEKVTVTVEVLDESYAPTDEADLSLEVVEKPESAELSLPSPRHAGAGKYRFSFSPPVAGGYRIRAKAVLQGRSLGSDDLLVEAAEQSPEWFHVMPRPGLLKRLSQDTGGAAITAEESPRDFRFNRTKMEQEIGRKDVPLWDNWIAFSLCFLLMSGGWLLRRKWGLR